MFAWKRILGVMWMVTMVVNQGCRTPDASQPSFEQKASSAQKQEAKKAFVDQSTMSRDLSDVEVPPPKIKIATYLAAAQLHQAQGNLTQAIQQYQYALQEDPNNADLYGGIGVLYDRQSNRRLAEEAYQKALQIQPNNATVLNNFAFSYIMRRDWAKAEVQLQRAIALKPDFTRARMNLAMTQAQLGRYDEAFKNFSYVLPPADAHYNMGLMYQSKRMVAEATKEYKEALKANPQMVAAQEQLKRMPMNTAAVNIYQDAQARRASETTQQKQLADQRTLVDQRSLFETSSHWLVSSPSAASQPPASQPAIASGSSAIENISNQPLFGSSELRGLYVNSMSQ